MSLVRAHQVGFSLASSEEDMQLYLKPRDVVSLKWSATELLPRHIIKDPTDIKVNVQMFQKRDRFPRWHSIPNTLISNLNNTGELEFTIPDIVELTDCANQHLLCPVAFNITAVEGTTVSITGREVELPSGPVTPQVGIWSSLAYLQSSDATEASLSQVCDDWFAEGQNGITTARLIVVCPPTLALAASDMRFRRQELESIYGDFKSGYTEAAMKFYYPQASVCYLQTVITGRYVLIIISSCCPTPLIRIEQSDWSLA